MMRPNNKGFTLVELLVVIAIIGVLVTIVVVAINPLQLIRNSQDSRMRSDLQQIKASMQLYYNDCKAYPTTTEFGNYSGTVWNGSADALGACSGSTTVYMRRVPQQINGDDYLYAAYDSSGGACDNGGTDNCLSYVAGAVLFNPSVDDDLTDNQCSSGTFITVGSATANYEVCND